ncbi:hypothetical protein Hanom_Chr11g01016471 [Helianthus anomalus]
MVEVLRCWCDGVGGGGCAVVRWWRWCDGDGCGAAVVVVVVIDKQRK